MRLRNWPRVRLGLRARLILSFLVVVLPAILLLVLNDYQHYLRQQHAIFENSRAEGQAIALLVQARLDQIADAGRPLLGSRRLAEEAGPAAAAALLEEMLAAHPEYLDAFILDAHGELVAFAPQGRPPLVHPALFSQASASRSAVVSELFLSPSESRPAVQVLVPGWSDQDLLGAVGITLDAEGLGSLLGVPARDRPFDITLCDRQGSTIYGSFNVQIPWEARDWSGYPHVRSALEGQPAPIHGFVSPLDSHTYVGAAVPVPGLGWVVNVLQPAQNPSGYLASQTPGGLLIFGALTALAVAVAAMVGGWLTASVSRLARHAHGLGRGQLNERIDMGAGNEFEDLAAALNAMARQIEERDRWLRARTAELEAIITQSADGIAIHGPEGELLRLNPAGIRILGRPPGRPGLSLGEQAAWFRIRNTAGNPIDPGDLPIAAALRGETRVGQELCVEVESGQQRFVAVSASPLSDAHGRIYGAVSIFRDMTLAHQSQQEKDDFVSVISHELKTPITSIKGYAQMLLRRAEEVGSDERDLKGLRIINDEVERMVDLINQLLDVSRLETHRLQLNWDRVDLVALVCDAVDRLQMTTDRHTLQPRVPSTPLWVEGDAMRLAQVLGNLVMNAIKYSPAGGPVQVSLESQEGRAWISVRDWGIGIPPEDQPHVFQRFYRGTRKSSSSLTGMGLGLYISREIIQRHHGDIVFHSQPGQGTTFLFWLPLTKEGEPGPEQPR